MTDREESEAVAVLRTALRAHLERDFGRVEVDEEDFVVRRGGALVFVRPGEQQGKTFVRIVSITNVGVTIDGELTRFLATENSRLTFGKFCLDEDVSAVVLAHTLLGDFLNRKELEVAVGAVAEMANEYDQTIKSRFGGRRFTDVPGVGSRAVGEATADGAAAEADGADLSPPERATVVRYTRIALLAFAAAIGAGVYAYTIESSIWLSLFVSVLVLQVVGRGIPDLITDPNKGRRALYFLLGPVVATGILAGTYALWERWWLSAPLGLIGGLVLSALFAPRLFRRIHDEEVLDSARRLALQRRLRSDG